MSTIAKEAVKQDEDIQRLLSIVFGRHENKLFLWGPPGTGKTYLAVQAAMQLMAMEKAEILKGCEGGQELTEYGKKRIAILDRFIDKPLVTTFNRQSDPDQQIGHYVPGVDENGNPTFMQKWGPIGFALAHDLPIVMNELANAPGEMQSCLYAVCDDPNVASVSTNFFSYNEKTGEREPINLHVGSKFAVIGTDNVGPSALPAALQDRFTMTYEVTTRTRGIDEYLGNAILAAWEHIKREVNMASCPKAYSIRSWILFKRLSDAGIDAETSSLVCFGRKFKQLVSMDNAAPEDKDVVQI